METTLHNKLVDIRNGLYFRAKESNCPCKDCKECLLAHIETLNEILDKKTDKNEGDK